MPRFAANLSMLYPQHAFMARFAAAAADGFTAVEYLFPYEHPAAELAAQLQAHGLQQVLFNAPPGDFAQGERGIAALPGREDEFRRGVHQALDYAAALDCPRIHVMAGLVPGNRDDAGLAPGNRDDAGLAPGNRDDAGLAPDGADRAAMRRTYLSNLAWAAEQAKPQGVNILIEPINTRDIPGFFLNRQDQAHAIVQELGATNLKVQMDLYHCQIVEGDLTCKLRQYLPTGRVGHIQIAGVPLRHEPDLGEVNFPALFGELDALGYDGWVGCEYRPKGDTSSGLEWLKLARQAR